MLTDALTRYKAIAAAGVMIDVHTGEIVAARVASRLRSELSGHRPRGVKDRFNRITSGIYELGSTFKTVTMAAALDSGKVQLTDSFDARFGVRFGRFTIDDFHGKHRILTVPEIYKYSSNIGTIKTMQQLGKDDFRAFLGTVGFDKPAPIELPERRQPKVPEKFSEIVAATASFGHGLSISPLRRCGAIAAFVNGGNHGGADALQAVAGSRPKATYERSHIAPRHRAEHPLPHAPQRAGRLRNAHEQVRRQATARAARPERPKRWSTAATIDDKSLNGVRLGVPARQSALRDGRSSSMSRRNENEQSGRTAGWNAGEATGRIIQQVAPMLGISPTSAKCWISSLSQSNSANFAYRGRARVIRPQGVAGRTEARLPD